MKKRYILFLVLIFTSLITGCKKEKKQTVLANDIVTLDETDTSKEKEIEETTKEITKEEETKKQIKKRKEEVKLNVENIQQLPEYRSGCEITSTAILLNYLGYKVSKTELAKYLPICDFYYSNGSYYSGDPNTEFCGTLEDGFGCFSAAIEQAIKNYFFCARVTKKVINISGASPEVLYNNVSDGRPVLVWVTISMVEPSDGWHWIIEETGQEYVWQRNEHCVVLIGYTKDTVILSDPYDKRGEVEYPKELFEKRYMQMNSQAIVIK